MKKALLIVNPKAGKSKARTWLYQWIETLGRADYAVNVIMTQKPGHATDAVYKYGKEHDLVVCAGGDGTLNEAITGLLRSGAEVPVGYIPTGSTNDFASTLCLSKDPRKAVRDVVKGVKKGIDVGAFNDRYFTYVASFGIFTKASYSTPQESKNVLGHLAYILEGIKDLPTTRAEHVRIVTPEKTFEDDYIFGAIANSTSLGGVMKLDDKVVMMNDGKFELLLVKKPGNMGDLSLSINAILSQNYDTDMIEFLPIESAVIESENPLVWSIDGERADTDGHVNVKNLHCAISMMLPTAAADSSIL